MESLEEFRRILQQRCSLVFKNGRIHLIFDPKEVDKSILREFSRYDNIETYFAGKMLFMIVFYDVETLEKFMKETASKIAPELAHFAELFEENSQTPQYM